MLRHAPTARVLFDESHSQAYSVREEVARAMQPSHPGDASFVRAAELLRTQDVAVEPHRVEDGPLDAAALAGAQVLVLAHPSDPKWETTVPGGSPLLAADELDAIEAWVRGGGGLVVLGETEQEKYGNNLNALLGRFGLAVANANVQDYEQHRVVPSWILADLAGGEVGGVDLLARVDGACFYRAGTLALGPEAHTLARASRSSTHPGAPLLAVQSVGAGRVVLASDSDLFSDDCLEDLGHRALWSNLVIWAAGGAWAQELAEPVSPLVADPHWALLRDEVDALRLLQAADGSIAEPGPDVRGRVARIAETVEALRPHVPHQDAYLTAALADLRAWADGGFGVPDFTDALEAFRPDRDRRDGAEHLVLFPMYKQNGPREKTFEALVVRVPWPDWLAELEATRYDNAKFIPVTLQDHTAGYDSECAVLFPETVSVAGAPANHFGGIFCDREAERFRRTSQAAADLLRVNVPPDAAALLVSEGLSRDAYELWDLVHDRTHSHGDLPFDPFMIRQRAPYWMYALEELRCDLTAFSEAVTLEQEGFVFARHAQYAILFDRLFRFPVTGPRVRNYDGLGGQLLFAFLHRTGRLHWTDNRLTIDWERVAEGVMALRSEVEALYKAGIDRTKLAHWVRRTTSSRPMCRRRPARGGPRARGPSPRRRTRGRTSTRCCPTSSRCRSSTARCRRSSRRRSSGRPASPSLLS